MNRTTAGAFTHLRRAWRALWLRAARPDVVVHAGRVPHVRRWYVFKSWRDKRLEAGLPVRTIDDLLDFNVCVHKFLASDHKELHDHSWNNWTIVLRGTCREEYFIDNDPILQEFGTWIPGVICSRLLTAGSVRRRRAAHAHRLIIARPVWTLFITGRWRRDWGYWSGCRWTWWQHR